MARRIALMIHSLAGGGAERIAAMMAKHWAERGDEISLITLDSVENDTYAVGDEVRRIGLSAMKHSSNPLSATLENVKRLIRLRNTIRAREPDHVVSLVDKMNVLTLLSCLGLRKDVVICERVHPRQYRIGLVWSMLRRISYPWCRALTVQTEQIADYARRFVGRRPIYVVPNPVVLDGHDDAGSRTLRSEMGTSRCLVAMGRLVEQKGFDMLLDAFAEVAPRHPSWKLRILGDGPLRAQLENRIDQLALRNQVELLGWVSPPYDKLRESDVYVLSSRFEGFPMGLLEAMACGLPVIAFDCESGPRDIVRDGIDGQLISPNNVSALASAMDRLMSDDQLRKRFASRATEVKQRFSQEKFFERWEEILNNAAVPFITGR